MVLKRNCDPEFYTTDIFKLLEKYEKCLKWEGDYTEK